MPPYALDEQVDLLPDHIVRTDRAARLGVDAVSLLDVVEARLDAPLSDKTRRILTRRKRTRGTTPERAEVAADHA